MNFIAQCIHLQSNSYRGLGLILRFFKNSKHHFKKKDGAVFPKPKLLVYISRPKKKVLNLTPSSKKALQILKEYKGPKGAQFKTIRQGYAHDMSIDKLLQFSLSNYRLLLYFSFIWIWNFQDFLVCLWTFKWGGGSFLGDIGCAVFIVEATNPKNLDSNKNLNLIIIEIEI